MAAMGTAAQHLVVRRAVRRSGRWRATCGATARGRRPGRDHLDPWHENGRDVWTCDRCSREHLRSIEGKLD